MVTLTLNKPVLDNQINHKRVVKRIKVLNLDNIRLVTKLSERDNSNMAGTKIGGKKAAAKNLARDPRFYETIGRRGGSNGNTGGFAANPELARIAGQKGGTISRRKKRII